MIRQSDTAHNNITTPSIITTTIEFMTGESANLSSLLLEKVIMRSVNEVEHVNRVFHELTINHWER
jgi:GMP synthase PP-ATPase subunit